MQRLQSSLMRTPRRSTVMPRWRLLFLALLIAWTPRGLPAGTFTASLSPDSVTAGDSAVLTLTIEGNHPKSAPALPPIANLRIESGGQSQGFQSINGQMTRTASWSYYLTPSQPGEYTIPALKAEVDGQNVTSQPVKLKAVKANDLGGPEGATPNEPAFLRFVVPKKEAFVGEAFAIELQLYLEANLANADEILGKFDQLAGTLVKAEGFSVLKSVNTKRQVRIGNTSFKVGVFSAAVSPVKTGDLVLGTPDFNLVVQVPVGSMGFFQRVQNRQIAIHAFQEPIHALPVPHENVPPDFNGAVGTFSLTVQAAPTNVAVGDLITVKIRLSGKGPLEPLALPAHDTWQDFKTYPPTSTIEPADALAIEGVKTFEEIVVPQSTDIKQLPPVSFSFFDPEQKCYRTLEQPPIPLSIRAGAPALATTRNPGDNGPALARDIVPIRQRPGPLVSLSAPLVQQPWFLALQGVPALAFIGSVVWRRRQDALASNPRLRRQRAAARIIRRGLTDLRTFAAENNSEQFFAALFHLLQEQLGERLDLPASAITEAVIDERLRPGGAPEPTIETLHELFQACNLARYAPVQSGPELAAIIPKLESVLRELQQMKL
jgi:hypothetical protein